MHLWRPHEGVGGGGWADGGGGGGGGGGVLGIPTSLISIFVESHHFLFH